MSCLVQLDPDVALPPEPDGQQFGKPLQGGGETATDNDYLVEQVVEGTKVEPKEGPKLNFLGKEQYFPQNGTMYHMLNPCSKPMKQ